MADGNSDFFNLLYPPYSLTEPFVAEPLFPDNQVGVLYPPPPLNLPQPSPSPAQSTIDLSGLDPSSSRPDGINLDSAPLAPPGFGQPYKIPFYPPPPTISPVAPNPLLRLLSDPTPPPASPSGNTYRTATPTLFDNLLNWFSPERGRAQLSRDIENTLLGPENVERKYFEGKLGPEAYFIRERQAIDNGLPFDSDAEARRTDGAMHFQNAVADENIKLDQWKYDTLLAASGFIPLGPIEEIVAQEGINALRSKAAVPVRDGVETLLTKTKPYKELSGKLPKGYQAHHLNQNAVYSEFIRKGDGLSLPLKGNAITDIGSPHYEFHKFMEENLWNLYREDGENVGRLPINQEYGDAVERALKTIGYSEADAGNLAAKAAQDRIKHGLLETEEVPRLPRIMNQKKP